MDKKELPISNLELRDDRSLPLSFSHYAPKEPLSEFVEIFWYWQSHDLLRGKEYVLPSGTVELVIGLGSGRTSGSGVCGTRSKPFLIGDSDEDRLLGVHFKPGGAFPFLPFPSWDLHNINITLDDLWGERRASQLLSLLHEAKTVAAKFQVLERWLLSHKVHPLKHHPAVSLAMLELQREPNLSMAHLAGKVNLSQRRFIQIFRNEMGLTPKLFSRVHRFQCALDIIGRGDAVDWLEVALSCGYFDQAHFIHDFQEFSGLTPTRYLGLRSEHRNHLAVPN